MKGLKVMVDAANGAAWQTAPEILKGLGAEVEAMADQPDGKNINEGCGSEHPEKLVAAVKAKKGWIGLAHDGDADRLVLVDEEGERVDGDEVIAMAALDALERGALPGKTVVATVMSNLGLDEAMAKVSRRKKFLASQKEFEFDKNTGRFAQSSPTVKGSEDLDRPTFQRKGIVLRA